MEPVRVMISGGFWLAYHDALPEFERTSGISVTTLSGASQGTGPKTIRYQLENGADIDVVILSREGLHDLAEAGLIHREPAVGLATAPLAAAVRQGSPRPDIASVESFRQALLDARLVVMPGSTSGLFVRDVVFPQLGVSDTVTAKVVPRGTDSTALLASGGADLAIGPVSELVDQPGIEIVGPLPDGVQLVQMFMAAIVGTSRRIEAARRLLAFLHSDRMAPAIRKSGMMPASR